MAPLNRKTAARLILLLALGAQACGSGDSNAGPPDANPECWPIETSTPGGAVEIGTGLPDFEPMEGNLQFIYGNQGGTYLRLHAAIQDMVPGDPTDTLHPDNPKTKFHAILQDDSIVGTPCASTMGYEPREDGSFERARTYFLEFLPFAVGEAAFDTELTLVVEVIDADGTYARDERTVFCEAPDPP